MIEPIRITPFSLAQRFIGLKEVSGKVSNPAILAMLQLDNPTITEDEIPWCSAFVNYICWLLRMPRSKSLAARSWLEVGQIINLPNAQVGFDIMVFWRGDNINQGSGHVGFYAGDDDPKSAFIATLGGNQNNTVGVNGYARDRLLGIRRISP